MEEFMKQRRKAQILRKSQTKEENHLWYDFLKTYPVPFRRQYQIGCYYADFYCYKARLVVELDGTQHTDPAGIAYDQNRTRFMEQQGLAVLRFSNLDVWRNFSGVCQAIHMAVTSRMQG